MVVGVVNSLLPSSSSNLLKEFSAQEVMGAVGHAPLQDCAVIIDSISTLLLYHKLSHVVRSLKLLGTV